VLNTISINHGNGKKRKWDEMQSAIQSRREAIVNWAHVKYLKSQNILDLWNRRIVEPCASERGDVPGWVLVVLMTTGLVTAIWTIAAPRLTSILKNSLDAMNGIR
jgi:hypothetical protein